MYCCATLNSIERHCGPNAPKIKPNIYVACIDDVATIPAATEHVVTTDITMEDTKVFHKWAISPVDPGFAGEPEGDVDGLSLPINLTVFIPNMTGAKSHILNNANGGEFVVVVEDKNGTKWILGDLNDGAFLKAGVQTNDKNGYTLVFEWESSRMPYEYTGAIAA